MVSHNHQNRDGDGEEGKRKQTQVTHRIYIKTKKELPSINSEAELSAVKVCVTSSALEQC